MKKNYNIIRFSKENMVKAEEYSKELFEQATKGTYKNLTKEELREIADNLFENVAEIDGSIALIVDDQMPTEGKVDFVYKPTYALAALLIYSYNNYPEMFNEKEFELISKILNKSIALNLLNHGYDAEYGYLKNMLVFCQGGLKKYLEKPIGGAKKFNDFMREAIVKLEGIYFNTVTKGIKYNINKFKVVDATNMLIEIISIYKNAGNRIFVYGTLMRGERANELLKVAVYAGEGILKNYGCYDLGTYPAVVEEAGKSTVGEIWYVDDETLEKVEHYEGDGTLYTCKEVKIEVEEGEIDCYAYVYNSGITGGKVNGKWSSGSMRNKEKYVWYACYGSNLNDARFKCYIAGGEFNGKKYKGCDNKTLWEDDKWIEVPGRLYFANESGKWNNKGVAFYDKNGEGITIMRLYKITEKQFKDVHAQEGNGDSWYGEEVILGVAEDGLKIKTFTNKSRLKSNAPDEEYRTFIEKALVEEGGYNIETIKEYINLAIKNI